MTAVCIVIPCYNEAGRMPAKAFTAFAGQHPEIHFFFVNDGSTDGTGDLLRSTAAVRPGGFEVIDLPVNGGKAEAVRAGMLHAVRQNRFEYIGFWDADLATPLEEIPRFLAETAADSRRQLVMGSRIRRLGAFIDRHWYRHYFGRVFATLTSFMLDMPVYDTQCGAKLMHSTLAKSIFDRPFITRWLFDVELVARTINLMGPAAARDAIFELPLSRWEDKEGSKVSLKTVIATPWHLFLIHRHYHPRKAGR